MSYILEALRRAEAQRQRGAVPGLHAQPVMGALADPGPLGPVEAGWRWRWPLLVVLAAGLLGLAAGLGWWLKPAAGLALEPGKPLPVAAKIVPVVPVVPVVPGLPVVPVAPATRTAATAPAARPAPAVPTAPDPALATAVPRALSPVAPAPRQSLAPPPPSPPPAERLPTLAELPEALRRELQPLSLGGLVFAEQSTLRIAIVNGQVFHEGDKPLPDLLVQQIRPKSVVFGFRGQRFELAL